MRFFYSRAPDTNSIIYLPLAEIRSMETPLRVRPYSSSEVQSRLQQQPDGTTTSYTAYRYPTSLQGGLDPTRTQEYSEYKYSEELFFPQLTTSIG